MDREERAGRVHFTCTDEFIIVPDAMVERLVIEREAEKETYISKEDVFPAGYLEYLERVLNVNHQNPAFSYNYIEEEPIGELGIFTILVRQLKSLKVGGKDCFRDIRLIVRRNGEINGIVVK